MKSLKDFCSLFYICSLMLVSIFFSPLHVVSAESSNWVEVASNTDGIQFIDTKSINYDSKGILSVITRFSDIDPKTKEASNTNSYRIEINCEKRLIKNNTTANKAIGWEKSSGNKLAKQVIIKSCSY